MKLRVERYSLVIEPEDDTDEAYIEEVLGLRHNGDSVKLVRENAMGLSCLGNLATRVEEDADAE